MKRFLTGLLLAAAVACSSGTEPELDAEATASIAAALGSGAIEITLRHGEERRVNESILRIGFNRVMSDSRCPIDAVCVWMGDAVVELGVAAGTGPTFPLELHTSLEPRSATWNGVVVSLLELTPAPKASEPTHADAYMVRIRVERVPH